MATYYPQYKIHQSYNYSGINEWNPLSTVQVPNLYTLPAQHIPVAIITPQLITPVCPFTNHLIAAESILTSVVPNAVPEAIPDIYNNLHTHSYKPEVDYVQDITAATKMYNKQDEYTTAQSQLHEQVAEAIIDETKSQDPVQYYLTLPRQLFPTPRMIAIDPNPIIDEFCKISNINENVPWILDLEFGVPRVPITRAIAVYDVKFNSVHCKNTPTAIHPGFEKCNSGFKRVLLFYYDLIVSNWYKGYITLNYDKSVKNFQSWLSVPMQVFGMCWP